MHIIVILLLLRSLVGQLGRRTLLRHQVPQQRDGPDVHAIFIVIMNTMFRFLCFVLLFWFLYFSFGRTVFHVIFIHCCNLIFEGPDVHVVVHLQDEGPELSGVEFQGIDSVRILNPKVWNP